jgi:hypothetical protein
VLLTDCSSVLPWVPSSVFSWHIAVIYRLDGGWADSALRLPQRIVRQRDPKEQKALGCSPRLRRNRERQRRWRHELDSHRNVSDTPSVDGYLATTSGAGDSSVACAAKPQEVRPRVRPSRDRGFLANWRRSNSLASPGCRACAENSRCRREEAIRCAFPNKSMRYCCRCEC